MVCIRATYHIFVSAAMRQINLIGMHNKLILKTCQICFTKFITGLNDAACSLNLLTQTQIKRLDTYITPFSYHQGIIRKFIQRKH